MCGKMHVSVMPEEDGGTPGTGVTGACESCSVLLATELRSSSRAELAPNRSAISLGPVTLICLKSVKKVKHMLLSGFFIAVKRHHDHSNSYK